MPSSAHAQAARIALAISQQPDSSTSKAIMKEHYRYWDSIDFNDMKELFGGNITDDNILLVINMH